MPSIVTRKAKFIVLDGSSLIPLTSETKLKYLGEAESNLFAFRPVFDTRLIVGGEIEEEALS